jgi:hypothetical protein
MIAVARVVMGTVLLAHGLVHLLFLAPDEPTFSFDRSWLVPDGGGRTLGIGLLVATVAAFALLALAVWGVPGLSAAWPAITVVAALLSTLLLLVFWDRWLVIGLAIDVALVAVAVTRPLGAGACRPGRVTRSPPPALRSSATRTFSPNPRQCGGGDWQGSEGSTGSMNRSIKDWSSP